MPEPTAEKGSWERVLGKISIPPSFSSLFCASNSLYCGVEKFRRWGGTMLIILIILLLVVGFGGYRMGPGLGYYGGGGLGLILLIVIILLLLRVI